MGNRVQLGGGGGDRVALSRDRDRDRIGIGEGQSLTTGVIDLSEMEPSLFHLSGQGSVSHRVAGEGARDGVR